LFAAVAGVGAGLEVAVEVSGHHTEVDPVLAAYVVAVPVALVLVLVWVLHRPLVHRAEVPAVAVFPAAALVLLVPLATGALGLAGVILAIAVVIVLVVAVTVLSRRRTLAP
jgi:hypothetical protein